MKKIIIISIALFLSLPMAAQRTVKASSTLELIYKVNRKSYKRAKFSKRLREIREQIASEIDKIFMADTIFIISREDIHESAFSELIWSKNDSIEYTFHYHNQILYKDEGDIATNLILKKIRENKPLSKLLKECDYDYDLVTVIKIIRERPNIYNYFIYYTYFYWDPAYILHEYEQEQYNKARKE